MLPITHAIVGGTLAIVLYFIFPQIGIVGASLLFLSSVFIDVDHYLYYIFKKRSFSLKKAYNWFFNQRMRRVYSKAVLVFHGVEFLAVLFMLIYVSGFFMFAFFGVVIHLFLDMIDAAVNKMPFYSKLSQIYAWQKNKKRK